MPDRGVGLLAEPLWDQFAALLPDRPVYDPARPLGCSYESLAVSACPATTIRERRDE